MLAARDPILYMLMHIRTNSVISPAFLKHFLFSIVSHWKLEILTLRQEILNGIEQNYERIGDTQRDRTKL